MAQEHEKIKVELRLSQENKQQLFHYFPISIPPVDPTDNFQYRVCRHYKWLCIPEPVSYQTMVILA